MTHSLTLVLIMRKNLPKIFECVYRERQGCKESFGKPMLNTQWRDCEPATKIGIPFKETVQVKSINHYLELPHAEGDDADGGGGHEAGEGGAGGGLGVIVGSHSR